MELADSRICSFENCPFIVFKQCCGLEREGLIFDPFQVVTFVHVLLCRRDLTFECKYHVCMNNFQQVCTYTGTKVIIALT